MIRFLNTILISLLFNFIIPAQSIYNVGNNEIIRHWHVDNEVTFTFDKDRDVNKLFVILPVPESNNYHEVSNVEYSIGCQYFSDCCPHVCDLCENGFNGHITKVSFDVEFKKIDTDFSKITTIYPYDTTNSEYIENTGSTLPYVDIDNPYVQLIGESLWEDSTDYLDYARKCSEYVSLNLTYILHKKGLLPLAEVLALNGGECGDFTSLFVSLVRYKGIPARHVAAIGISGDYHVWPEFYLENYGWIPVDPTWDNSSIIGGWFGKHNANFVIMSKGLNHKLNNNVYNEPIDVGLFQTFSWIYWYSNPVQANAIQSVNSHEINLGVIDVKEDKHLNDGYYSLEGIYLKTKPQQSGVYIQVMNGESRKVSIMR